jgi:hypothetical protein
MLGRLFRKKLVDQDRFTSGPYVAVWVGQHASEEQLDEYLFSGRFSEEFRFRVEDRLVAELDRLTERMSPAEDNPKQGPRWRFPD